MRSFSPHQPYPSRGAAYISPRMDSSGSSKDQYHYLSPPQPKSDQPVTTVLKPIVYEAMHVPINDQIQSVKLIQPISPTTAGPPSGQIKQMLSPSPPMIFPQTGQFQPQNQFNQSFSNSGNQNQHATTPTITVPQDHRNGSVAEFQLPMPQETPRHEERYVKELEDRIKIIKQDCELWKQKYQQNENLKHKLIADLEAKSQEELHTQLISQKQIYQQSLSDMAEDMKHLQRELDNSQKDCEKIRKRCHKLEMEQFEIKTQQVDAQAQRDQYQKELQRVQALYQRLKHEFEDYRVTIEIGRKRTYTEQEVDKLKDLILQRENEIEDLKQRNTQLEITCIDVKKLESVNCDLLQQLTIMETQVDMAEQKILQLQQEYESLNSQNKKLTNQLASFKNSERIQKTIMEQDLINQISQLNQQLQDKELQIKSLQQQKNEQSTQMQKLMVQVKQQKENYELELEDLKEKQTQFESEFQANIQYKFQLLNEEIKQLQQERNQILSELSQLQHSKAVSESRVQQSQKEIESYAYQLQLKAKELSINQENINILNQKFNQLTYENQQLNEQLHKLHHSYQDRYKSQSQFQMVLCYIEMEATRDRLNQALQELDEIKQNQIQMVKFT